MLSTKLLVMQFSHRKDKVIFLLVHNYISHHLSVRFNAILFHHFFPHLERQDRYHYIYWCLVLILLLEFHSSNEQKQTFCQR